MKHTVEVTDISGFNESPVSGNYIIVTSRLSLVSPYLVVGISTLTNSSKTLSGLVSAVTDLGDGRTQISAPGVNFAPGEFFLLTLATAWTIQNDDLPLIEVECNVCGWSYPQKELVNGKCKVCLDAPRPV